MSTRETRLHAALERGQRSGVQCLKELIAIPSPIGAEGRVQSDIARRMRDLGLEVDVFDIDPSRLENAPLFNRHPRSYANRPCVVGVLRGGGGGRSLILNAHADTAPLGDPDKWTHSPTAGVIEGDRIFGRGSWDDKAGIAMMLSIVEALREADVKLDGDLILKSVVEDEESGNGTLACLERGFRGDGAIVLDGTWPERFIVTHMGHVWFEVTLEGRSVASSVCSRGLNPLLGVGHVVNAFQAFVDEKNRASPPWGAMQNPCFVNLGRVEGGSYAGSVPSGVRIEGNYGFLPPTSLEEAREEIRAVVSKLSSGPWPLESSAAVRFFGADTPWFIGKNSGGIVDPLKTVIRRLRGADVIENVITGWCDLRHYESNPWFPSVPALLYGPGGGGNPHIEDEFYRLDHFVPVAQNVASVALEWTSRPPV